MGFNAWVFEDRVKPLEYKEVTIPSYVNDDFVSLSIKAAALNRRDFWITQGLYPDIPENIPAVLGSDCCGTFDGKEYIVCPNINWGDGYFHQQIMAYSAYMSMGPLRNKSMLERINFMPNLRI